MRKKRVFYNSDILPFLIHGKTAIDKLKRNLELFYEHREEVVLVWHIYYRMQEFLELNESPVTEEFKKIRDIYIREGWGELDETSDRGEEIFNVLKECDAYYGDTSHLISYAQEKGIPVMMQDVEV